MAGQVRQISTESEGRSADDQQEVNVNSANVERTKEDTSAGYVTQVDAEDFIKVG